MKRLTTISALGFVGALISCGPPPVDNDPSAGEPGDVATGAFPKAVMPSANHPVSDDPTRRSSELVSPAHAAVLAYQGGPVLSGQISVYYIYYGNWTAGSARTALLEEFARNLGETPWWNINTLYSATSGAAPTITSPTVRFGGSIVDRFSQGQPMPATADVFLTDPAVETVVNRAVNMRLLPNDPNGVYMVLGSAQVNQFGLCNRFCGWHAFRSARQIAFAADASVRCPADCRVRATSPNGDPGADSLINVIAHEVAEAAVDPRIDAWVLTTPGQFGNDNNESADLCNSEFGSSVRTLSNGSLANQHIGNRDYLIQQNWLPIGDGFCASGWQHKNDIAWYNLGTEQAGAWQLFPNGSVRKFGDGFFPVPGFNLIGAGDFDGDGNYDFMWRDPLNFNIQGWKMLGTAHDAADEFALGKAAGLPRFADFDGDGRTDVAFFDTTNLTYTIWKMASPGKIRGKETHVSRAGTPVVADYDGDGRADVLYVSGSGFVLDTTSQGVKTAPVDSTITFPTDTDAVSGRFLTGPREQTLVRRPSDGQVSSFGLRADNTLGVTSLIAAGAVSFDWVIKGAGDIDGNGREDILWHNSNDGNMTVWKNMPTGFVGAGIIANIPASSGWIVKGMGSDHTMF